MSTAWLESLLSASLANAAVACVLAVVAFVVSRTARRPAVAHFLWLLVLLKLVTPPIWRIPSSRLDDLRELAASFLHHEDQVAGAREDMDLIPLEVAEPAEPSIPCETEMASASVAIAAGAVEDTPREARTGATIFAMVAAAWLGTAAVILIVAVTRILRFDRLLGRARSASPELAAVSRDVARRFGLGRPPEVVIVDARVPPLVWALRSPPRIVLPSALLDDLTPRQVETLIAHETAHLRRRDHWVRWLEMVVVAAFWWHPIAWWARRELRRAEEQCCDAWVQQSFSRDVQEYARALFVTVEFLSTGQVAVPRTASGLGEGKLLRRRFEMILHASLPCRIPTSLLCPLVIAGAAVLPWAPGDAFGQRAETPEPAGGASPADPAQEAPRALPVPPSSIGLPTTPPHAGAVPPVAPVPPVPPRAANPAWPQGGDVEARLSRLEDQLAALLAEMRTLRSAGVYTAKRPAGAKASATPYGTASADGKTRYGLSADKKTVTATDAETGKVLWETEGEPRFRDPEINVDTKGVIIKDKETGATMRLDPSSGRAHISGKAGTGLVAGSGAGASSGVVIHTHPPVTAGGDDVYSQRDRLRAEKAKLRARLKEIEAEEATLDDEQETVPAPKPAKQ